MSLTTALYALAGVAPFVAFGLGWAFGYGKGRETYAELVGQQSERVDGLEDELKILSQALHMRSAPDPTLGQLRVPEKSA